MRTLCNKHLPLRSLLLSLLVFATCYTTAVEQVEVEIPMRDGVLLTTHLFIPKDLEKAPPCILIRTPGPLKKKEIHSQMASWGYVVAFQSLRSFSYPKDCPEPYFTDGWGALQDGYDTVEWLGNSSYTNGQVGTFGESANGITQLLLAPTRPKHLKCQFIRVATPTLYQHGVYVGGKLCKHQVENWFAKVAPQAYQSILKNTDYGSFWEGIDASTKTACVQTPAIHIGGWYDIFSQGTLDSFSAWQEKGGTGARGQQKLVMGPWTHWGSNLEKLGEYPVPENAYDLKEPKLIKSWFDYHLKGEFAPEDSSAPVQYYVMGPLDQTPSKGNVWKHAQKWPPKAEERNYYLSKSHKLSTKAPLFSEKKYSYNYDPKNPVPTLGGRNLYLPSGPFNQSKNEKRQDVLVFTSDILKEDTEVTGRIKALIYLSSSAPSADLSITLTDVYPNGQSVLISEGIQNVKVNSNDTLPVEVDLWSTSMVFAKDHQLRMTISGSNYPHFDKNEHEAHNVIHVGTNYPSKITLPVVLD